MARNFGLFQANRVFGTLPQGSPKNIMDCRRLTKESFDGVRRGAFVLLALGVLAATPALSQRLRVRTYSEGEGLPSSSVRGVTQDA